MPFLLTYKVCHNNYLYSLCHFIYDIPSLLTDFKKLNPDQPNVLKDLKNKIERWNNWLGR